MLTGRPVCECHGVEQYWNKDTRMRNGGGWRCRISTRERQRGSDLAYWHAPNGGYVQRRRRTLAAQRSMILARLDTLREEAERC